VTDFVFAKAYGKKAEKYDKFCHFVAGGMHPLDAYRAAGFVAANENTARTCGNRLKRKLLERIHQIMGHDKITELASDVKITGETISAIQAFQQDVAWARKKLHEFVNNEDFPPAVRLRALIECLNRGLGLPTQTIESNLNVRYVITDEEMTPDEWKRRYCRDIVIEGSVNSPIGPALTEH